MRQAKKKCSWRPAGHLLSSCRQIEHGLHFLLSSIALSPLPGREAQSFTFNPQPELGPFTSGRLVSSFLKYFQMKRFSK